MGWVVNATLRPLYPREIRDTYCIGGWVGLRAGLDRLGKSLPSPGFDPRAAHPVASRCTDWGIPAPTRNALLTTSVLSGKMLTFLLLRYQQTSSSDTSYKVSRFQTPLVNRPICIRYSSLQEKICARWVSKCVAFRAINNGTFRLSVQWSCSGWHALTKLYRFQEPNRLV